MKGKRIALLGLLTAVALTIFLVEAQIPAVIPVPGVKLGLANIVTVFTVYALGSWEGIAVLTCRVFLGAVFAGNFSTILYSAAGGFCAILATIGAKRFFRDNRLWAVGCMGAVAHSLGQLAAAIAVTRTTALLTYLPIMVIVSMVTGLFTGLCTQFLWKRGGKRWKTIFS